MTQSTVDFTIALEALVHAVARAADGTDVAVPVSLDRHEPDGRTTPVLPVLVGSGRVDVGPLVRPGTPGCLECLRLRTSRAKADHGRVEAVRDAHPAPEEHPLLPAPLVALVAELVAAEAHGRTARTHEAVLRVDVAGLRVTRHRFLPEPLCPVCGGLPDDTEDAARFTARPRPKARPDTYRVRPVTDELDSLLDLYVDAETGLVREMKRGTQGGLVVAGAMMPIRVPGAVEPGVGRSRGYRTSAVTGLLEALERYGGVEPGGRRTVVRGTYAGLANRALDPRTLGLHPVDRPAGADFRPFHPEAPARWVWGHSFRRGGPVLVPESFAYYYLRHDDPDDRPFAYEISNGCALGSCPEEAVLYGLLEAVERDAFLLAWYNRIPLPLLDVSGATDRMIPVQVAAITADTGYEVRLYDSTAEHGIPSVWAMAVRPDRFGDDRPMLVCAAGAHLTLERAIVGALSELGPLLADFVDRFPDERDRARLMVDDPDLVRTMHDHSTLYGTDEAFERLAFLDRTPNRRALPVADPRPTTDLADDLRGVVDRVLAAGLDVVVVDQTTPEHRAGGFSCVKVLVPGALPMTFGHRNRRIDGLSRVVADPNPHPHPFP